MSNATDRAIGRLREPDIPSPISLGSIIWCSVSSATAPSPTELSVMPN